MPGGLTLLASANADIPTPVSGKVTVFFSLTDGVPSYKNSGGTVLPLGTTGPTGSIGPAGPAIPFLFEGIQGEDGIPGPAGVAGSSASSGLTLIQTQTLAIDTTTVTFSAIPGTYNHLKLIIYGRITNAASDNYVRLRFNGDSGANYDFEQAFFFGTSQSLTNLFAQTSLRVTDLAGAGSTSASQAGYAEIIIPGYKNTSFFKQVGSFGGVVFNTAGNTTVVGQWGGQWRNAAAITQIDVTAEANDIKAGSILSLYGMQ